MRQLISIFLLFTSAAVYAQTESDYIYLNKILKQQVRDESFLVGEPTFSEQFNGESNINIEEKIKLYEQAINSLLTDTLSRYAGTIDREAIKDSFIQWNARYINGQTFTQKTNVFFRYITRPIIVSSNLFVVIQFDSYAGGAVDACLYKYNARTNKIRLLQWHTVTRYGLMNKW